MNCEVRDLREVIREEMLMRDKIIGVLKDGPRTVPEIAQALGYPSYEVMYWVMGMRKYGYVSETGEVTDEGYHKYKAVLGEGD
ncbi:MAG: MarR family transcriptional regulator [Peptococcaceae bacterium]|nr:MAG: MarR family transcriptional regulator [Peptococcaceae bacterium]